MLTGKSMPSPKSAEPIADSESEVDLASGAFMGTIVHQGSARGVVVSTGSATAFGRIAVGLGAPPTYTAFQATPQLLPAIVSVSLSAGSRRLARRRVLVKRLVTMENLGNIRVLFTDKTGTLTAGVLKFDRSLDAAGVSSLDPLRLGLVCNEATLTTVAPSGVISSTRRSGPHPMHRLSVPAPTDTGPIAGSASCRSIRSGSSRPSSQERRPVTSCG